MSRHARCAAPSTPLPKWNPRKGWVGGDARTLYAFTDRLTGRVSVHPISAYGRTPVGDNADVAIATREQALAVKDADGGRYWPKGWKVACGTLDGVRRRRRRR